MRDSYTKGLVSNMHILRSSDPILVTGASGFAGSHLITALLHKGFTNIHGTTSKQGTSTDIEMHVINLIDTEQTKKLVSAIQPAGIFHLASLAEVGNSFENQGQLYKNNGAIQENILEAIRLITPQARLVTISSAQIYGKSITDAEIPITESHEFRPINPYAVSKIHQDSLSYMYYSAHNLDIVRARPFNHIGERQTNQFVVSSLAEQIAKIEKGYQELLKVGNTDSIRDFTDVKDMVEAYIILMEKGLSGEVYNIGSGVGISIATIIEIFKNVATIELNIELDQNRLRPSDIPVMIASIEKIKALGWQPTIPLESTLKRILDYWRQNV